MDMYLGRGEGWRMHHVRAEAVVRQDGRRMACRTREFLDQSGIFECCRVLPDRASGSWKKAETVSFAGPRWARRTRDRKEPPASGTRVSAPQILLPMGRIPVEAATLFSDDL